MASVPIGVFRAPAGGGRLQIPIHLPTRTGRVSRVTMRDRAKNRKPPQRGRYLSVEAIQAVQALKRGERMGGRESVEMAMQARVRRLVKRDMMAVLGELQSQGEALLAQQVSSLLLFLP